MTFHVLCAAAIMAATPFQSNEPAAPAHSADEVQPLEISEVQGAFSIRAKTASAGKAQPRPIRLGSWVQLDRALLDVHKGVGNAAQR